MINEKSKSISAKKSLGQNFLTNKSAIKKVTAALGTEGGDTIIEIGPGHGELTKEIVAMSPARIIAIEKDGVLVERLRNEMGECGGSLEIIAGDALRVLPQLAADYSLQTTHYKLVGNIPFYITGFLLRILGELENKPKTVVLTVQKEVAERICARPPKMNLLAASVQFWAEPEIVGVIPMANFSPQPKVDSAIVKFSVFPQRGTAIGGNYYRFIRKLFKQPRKTVLNNLSGQSGSAKNDIAAALREFGVSKEARPQDLDQKTVQKLSEILYNAMGDSVSLEPNEPRKRKTIR